MVLRSLKNKSRDRWEEGSNVAEDDPFSTDKVLPLSFTDDEVYQYVRALVYKPPPVRLRRWLHLFGS